MSMFSPFRLYLSVALLAVVMSTTSSANTSLFEFGTDAARLATFENATGETSFALSLSPQITEQKQVASDIVIYVDTSASQTGMYRKDTLVTLRRLLANLNSEDRVHLFAVDIEPVELTDQFVVPGSDEIKVALDKLRKRVPLGSTDIPAMLDHAASSMEPNDDRNQSAIYIGDGVSRGNFLRTKKFADLVGKLVKNRVTFSSFAIGPERDIESLSAIANQTGGNVFVDSDDMRSITVGAKGLADTVHSLVFWPTKFELPTVVAEAFPATVPPLRTDRDTILVGTLKKRSAEINFELRGDVGSESTTMNWNVTSEPSNVDFAFLPKLVRDARRNEGVSLPTLGSAGLREMARVMSAQSEQLADLGTQALNRGDYSSAKTLSKAALGSDPINSEAEALLNKAKQDEEDDPFGFGDDDGGDDVQDPDPFGDEGDAGDGLDDGGEAADELPEPADEAGDDFGSEEIEAQDELEGSDSRSVLSEGSGMKDDRPTLPNQIQPGQSIDDVVNDGAIRLVNPNAQSPQSFDEIENLLRDAAGQSNDVINNEEQLLRRLTERMKIRVRVELQNARAEIANNAPGDAVERLKSMVDVIDQITNVDPVARADMRARLVSGLMTARRSKLEYEENLARRQEYEAIATEMEEARINYVNREIRLAGLINRFESLLNEGRFAAAEAVTREAREVAPERPATNVAYESAGIISNLEQNLKLRREREIAFLATLFESEKSATAFSGNPPLVFPDAAEWAAKVEKRKKYQDVRLAGNASDEAILNALDENADFDWDENPFIEVMDYLRDEYGINVVLDQSAKDDSLTEDELITFNVKGIRLKNALRLMLKDKNATFIVRDEVMRIISLDVASDPEFFVTNVYNVGDLVAPRIPIQGGGGGFGGGQGGGGQGGGGGFGGGQGGGGRGGGGGGGVFCIVDSLDTVESKEMKNKNKQVVRIANPTGDSPFEAWSSYFKEHHPAPARVRLTARELMQEKDTDQVVGLILGAIHNSQTQPWMYEALVLAFQIGDHPESEIARALSSAVDLSSDKNDVLIAAKHMIENKLEKQAIGLLRQIADFETNSPAAFVMALNAARRINDEAGIKWATLGIFNQAWPTHRDIAKQAMLTASGLRLEMKKQGRMDDYTAFSEALDKALYRDCIIKVSWTGDADVDLYVEEPGGTICSRKNPRTLAGGIMMGDAYSAGPDESGELAEYYVLPRGFSGDYRLAVRKIWGDVTANKVTVAVYHHWGTNKQTSEQRQVKFDANGGTLVKFHLKDGRRTASLEDHQMQVMAEKELFVGRNMLAQQFRQAYSSEVASDYYGSRTDRREDGIGGAVINDDIDNSVLMPRAVGYQPTIEQLFEGSTLTASATTADRLYVLVNAAPFFSAVNEVNTFNILGNADTALGGGGGGAGGGGGGGGIGGGMF